MSFYEKRILPHVINCACGAPAVARQRQKVVPLANGRVLELGIGTGLNAGYYRAGKVNAVVGLIPAAKVGDLRSLRLLTPRSPSNTARLVLRIFRCQAIASTPR